ncbi:MAG: FTR1 family protein [Acidimicrobiia bacterium]
MSLAAIAVHTDAAHPAPSRQVSRRCITRLIVMLAVAVTIWFAAAPPAHADSAVSRSDGIEKLQDTRRSIDRTLQLIKDGKSQEAFDEAVNGYLKHFEAVEIPLRVADNSLTIKAEGMFADIRTLIREDAPTDEVRDRIIELRAVLDTAERKLTDAGVGAPALVAGQAFLILFREGFEVVLLMSVLVGYLEAAKSTRYLKPILVGVALAAVATVITVLLMPVIFNLLPVGREVLEAITALVAVVVLFYVSFWLIARLEHKRWLEFVKARMWNAISVGSTASLVMVGFTAVYREGFETALFYQALLSFGSGLGIYIVLGVALGVLALTAVAWAMFHLGRRLPIKVFMNTAVAMVMATSIAFLGNAVHTLQSADVIRYHELDGWPRLPIFWAQATGYWPTRESVLAQVGLAVVYTLGAVYVFVIKPRLDQRAARPATLAAKPA